MKKFVIECEKCGKQAIVKDEAIDSTGMIRVVSLDCIAMFDIPKDKDVRDSWHIRQGDYCPQCLLTIFTEWITKVTPKDK
jgi:ribosomal protein S26